MAHYTTNFNLYEKDPATDGQDTFNITTMMNNNWDKIDSGVQKKLTQGDNITLASDGTISALSGLTSTVTELNYCDGVISNIQTQLNGKQASLPTLVSGQFLTNNGSTLSWSNVDALPTQSGQSGKYLTTNGSSASWTSITIPDSSEIIQNINTVSGTAITLVSTKSIYSKTITEATTFTFDASGLGTLTDKAVTFELYLTMSTVYTLTFPSSVTWIEEPSFTNTGKYLLVFKTFDGGTTWLGNLECQW